MKRRNEGLVETNVKEIVPISKGTLEHVQLVYWQLENQPEAVDIRQFPESLQQYMLGINNKLQEVVRSDGVPDNLTQLWLTMVNQENRSHKQGNDLVEAGGNSDRSTERLFRETWAKECSNLPLQIDKEGRAYFSTRAYKPLPKRFIIKAAAGIFNVDEEVNSIRDDDGETKQINTKIRRKLKDDFRVDHSGITLFVPAEPIDGIKYSWDDVRRKMVWNVNPTDIFPIGWINRSVLTTIGRENSLAPVGTIQFLNSEADVAISLAEVLWIRPNQLKEMLDIMKDAMVPNNTVDIPGLPPVFITDCLSTLSLAERQKFVYKYRLAAGVSNPELLPPPHEWLQRLKVI